MRARRDQMGMRDRMHLILDLRAVPDNLVAPRHQPPEAFGIRVGGQISGGKLAARSDASTPASILSILTCAWAIALTLQRIGDDHARDKRRQHVHDGHGVAGRLNDDLILLAKAATETLQPRARVMLTRPAGRSLPSSQNTT